MTFIGQQQLNAQHDPSVKLLCYAGTLIPEGPFLKKLALSCAGQGHRAHSLKNSQPLETLK